MRRPVFLISLLAIAAVAACAQQDRTIKPNAVTESYSLMDHSENAKAIVLLERELEKRPDDLETRIALASAYMGQAGIDVFAIHDSFKEVFFDESLSQSLFGDQDDEGPKQDEPKVSKDAPILKAAALADRDLELVRRAARFLHRFPRVKEKNWPLLEQALKILEPVGADEDPDSYSTDRRIKDIRLYRLFARVVYLRSYLTKRWLGENAVGTKAWACNVEVEEIDEELVWILDHLTRASQDLRKTYPTRSLPLRNTHQAVSELLDSLRQMREDTTPVEGSDLLPIRDRFRQAIGCGHQETPK